MVQPSAKASPSVEGSAVDRQTRGFLRLIGSTVRSEFDLWEIEAFPAIHVNLDRRDLRNNFCFPSAYFSSRFPDYHRLGNLFRMPGTQQKGRERSRPFFDSE